MTFCVALGRIKLKSLLDEKLYAQFFSLPRIMNSANEDVKLAKLQILKGYLNFYGDVLADVLNSYNHLKTFLKAILQVTNMWLSLWPFSRFFL